MNKNNTKLDLKGWVDKGEKKWNIITNCPKCNSKLSRTDAIGLIGVIFVYCKNSRCRWAELYQE